MIGCIEEMGKVTLFEFREAEGFGKSTQRHLRDRQRIGETDGHVFVIVSQLQDLASVLHLFELLFLSVQLVDHR